jgi:hypothetical protein
MAKGRKTGGRQRGTPNKSTLDVGAVCRQIVDDEEYRKYFKHRLMVGQLPPALEAMAWHYAYGKPPETLTLGGAVDLKTTVVHEYHPGS